jgi:recombination protein RecT
MRTRAAAPGQSDLHLTQAIAAIRESFEELGVLLARHADGTTGHGAGHRRDRPPGAVRRAVRAARPELAADDVFVLAHWVTDRDLPRRFDVPFLVARMPEGQDAGGRQAEQFEPVWVRRPTRWRRHEAGQFLHDLPDHPHTGAAAGLRHVQAVLDACAQRAAAVDQLPARRAWAARKRATWSTSMPYGELHAGVPRRPDPAPAGLADLPAPWRCCAT